MFFHVFVVDGEDVGPYAWRQATAANARSSRSHAVIQVINLGPWLDCSAICTISALELRNTLGLPELRGCCGAEHQHVENSIECMKRNAKHNNFSKIPKHLNQRRNNIYIYIYE